MVMKKRLVDEPEAFRRASPMHRVHPDAPPFFILHGTHDSLVSVEEGRYFAKRLRDCSNAPVAYAELPGAQHAFELFHSARCDLAVEQAALQEAFPRPGPRLGRGDADPGVLGVLLSRSSERTLGNVVVSHVPGPHGDVYWQGCRLAGLYPASVLLDLVTLDITVVSRHDFVDFGLIACRRSVPHVQRLLGHLESELSALEAGVLARVEVAAQRQKVCRV